jgi:hypothetical protein
MRAARPSPGLARKLRLDVLSGLVTGRIFFHEITEFFSARPEKCSGLREKYRWLVAICFERKVLLAGGL